MLVAMKVQNNSQVLWNEQPQQNKTRSITFELKSYRLSLLLLNIQQSPND